MVYFSKKLKICAPQLDNSFLILEIYKVLKSLLELLISSGARDTHHVWVAKYIGIQ